MICKFNNIYIKTAIFEIFCHFNPNISAACNGAVFFVIVRNFNAVYNSLCRYDLIRAHDKKHLFRSKDAVLCQDIQKRVFREKRLGKIDEVGNNAIVTVCPKGSKLKRVACLVLFPALCFFSVTDMVEARRIGIILCIRAVGNDKDLNVFKQSARCPKAVTLIPFDLIEGLAELYAAALEFNMYKRKAVYENGNIVPCFVRTAFFLILMNDLQFIVVNICFIDQADIFCGTVVAM